MASSQTASEADLPFLKKDFLEEYRSWESVERVDVSHMLKAQPTLQLKSMDPAPPRPRPVRLEHSAEKHKPVYEPLSDVQVRDRREMLRQQAALVNKARSR